MKRNKKDQRGQSFCSHRKEQGVPVPPLSHPPPLDGTNQPTQALHVTPGCVCSSFFRRRRECDLLHVFFFFKLQRSKCFSSELLSVFELQTQLDEGTCWNPQKATLDSTLAGVSSGRLSVEDCHHVMSGPMRPPRSTPHSTHSALTSIEVIPSETNIICRWVCRFLPVTGPGFTSQSLFLRSRPGTWE